MLLRAALTTLAACLALPVHAACTGDSFLAQLSDADQAEVAATTAATPFSEGLTWELTRDGKTLTVVGTMHVYDDRLAPLRDRVAEAVRTADLLLVEATAEEERAMQEAFAASPDLYLITDGPTLPDLLDPPIWDKVKEAASDRGIPGFMVAQMQPWYLSLTLGIPACAIAELAAGMRGLDHMLIAEAEAADVSLQALESWTTLIDTLSDSTQEEQIAALQLSLIDRADQRALYVAMLDAYFAEQTATVWTIGEIAGRTLTDLTAEEAAAQMAETQEILLTRRNRAWIPVIEAAAAGHDAIVVAAGAAHLPGEEGILALLADTGWSIARIE